MTDPSLGTKKKKVTYTASPQGVERAENALKRLGFDSKLNFARSQLLARSTVTKFFQCKPIQLDSFKKICKELTLNWREIAGITEEEQSERLERNDCSSSDTNEEVEAVQTLRRQVTVIDTLTKKIKAVIVLEGDINSVNNDLSITLELFLRRYSGDTIKITDIKEGSIRIIVEGSQEDIERLISQFELGELTEVSGFPVENIQILSESSDDDENNESDEKWRLVQEIVNQPVKGRNLSGADLSDADLSDADLSGADLNGADLSGADLSDANLSFADLSFADLSGADLSGADLSDADLSCTNLKGAIINKETQINRNRLLVWEIVNQGAVGRDLSNAVLSGAILSHANLSHANLSSTILIFANLSGATLSHANLSSADLSSAILSHANLSSAILSRANLSSAILSRAILSGAYLNDTNLSNANLSGANLSGANLSRADLSDAIVRNALFGGSVGLTEDMKRDLEQRGAVFGDRPPVLTPR